MKEPQTFIEAAEELHRAGAELFRAIFVHIEPFLDWLSKRLEGW